MLTGLKNRAITFLGGVPAAQVGVPAAQVKESVVAEAFSSRDVSDVRSYPLQNVDTTRFLYAPQPEMDTHLINYAWDVWVHTAVNELATDFASAPLEVWDRNTPRRSENHGLLKLLGPAGRPNPDQDRFEFLEQSFSNLVLTGNCYWFWYSRYGGVPDAVYNMPPGEVFVRPGSSEMVGHYVYRWQGQDLPLSKEVMTHFKLYHPKSKYYGLSPMEALRLEIQNDRNMARWNAEFFGDDVFNPAGVIFVPEGTSDAEIARLEGELEGKHGKRRRTMIMRVPVAGSQAWADAGLKHREIEFKEGRLLSRQAVYEALGLPLGLYSESSTEAHARVAERHKLSNVFKWHRRFAIKLDQDVLGFWPGSDHYEARFYDVRKVDWQMEAMKFKALSGVMTVDEIRERELQLPPMKKEESPAAASSAASKTVGVSDASSPDDHEEDSGEPS